ncbi:MAG: hypothetical protein A2541_01745 [Candidatus Taylorbacteria bacterium RIFOXYD2_FULL_36_9]|uniref:Transcriptional repressor PaaX-like central Cas2-like domain-containing protein n=1 Tax=Candidatus Taylorbacteria bacterium RIFOXYD2_FULL_36_9 TaxID=1802338 RepID=A0A1G2PH59_9BACT|nr:MAG: hypothetical protein A2541_01745 [Candidatus Taylorbacteria bacterium RIFOXYD2_FULL_36_9]
MGTLEASLRKEIRVGKIQKAILGTVAVAGLLGVAAVAPNVLQIFGKFIKGQAIKRSQRESINYSRRKLVNKGFLEYKDGFLKLTLKGKSFLGRLEGKSLKVAKPKRWDKKWRIIIFDIKEERKYLRDKIRNTLIDIGFIKLQKSVWVFPYDCEDLITLIKADFEIGKDVLYLIVDRIENDKTVREYFDL